MDDIPLGTEVALYLRCSTSGQKNSIEDQDSSVMEVVGRFKLRVAKRYADSGISGGTVDERDAIMAMIAEVGRMGIKYILIYDVSRLTRGGQGDFWSIIRELKKQGVLVYCCQRELFITEKNALQFCIDASQALASNLQHSRDIARTMVANVRDRKNAPGARPPFGYDRLYVDDSGKPFHQVRWNCNGTKSILNPVTGEEISRLAKGDSYSKIASHRVVFTPSSDDRVAAIERIFILIQSMGYSEVANVLNNDGLVGPAGGKMNANTLRDIIKNPAYTGKLVFNRTHKGRYHRIVDGQVVQLDELEQGTVNFRDNPENQWIIVPDVHVPLVSDEIWMAAQQAIESRTAGRIKTGRSKNRLYILSGIAVCGRCGAPLQGNTQRAKNGKCYPRYVCSTAHKLGKDQCPRVSISAETLEQFVMGKVKEILNLECVVWSLREGLEKMYHQSRNAADNLGEIRTRQEQLKRKKDALFAQLTPETLEAFKEQIANMTNEEAALRKAELSIVERCGGAESLDDFVNRHIDFYREHVLNLEGGCSEAIRESLRALGTKVVFRPDGKDGNIEVDPFGHSVGD